MSPEHEALKVQFEMGLKKAQDSETQTISAVPGKVKTMDMAAVQDKLPWQKALAMENDLIAKQYTQSSVRIQLLRLAGFDLGW